MKKIAIIDYKLSNLYSVKNALSHFDINVQITDEKNEILNADAAILPGVGSFGEAMSSMSKMDLVLPIQDFINSGKPFLGICLGLQLLFTESEEFGDNKGLNLIDGQVLDFKKNIKIKKTPHVGWNKVYKNNNSNSQVPTEFDYVKNEEYFYFVHSFYVKPNDENIVLTKTIYDEFEYTSSIKYENVLATQFHPEKSGEVGLSVLRKFLEMNKLIGDDNVL
tara:strand:- start:312 stop:974 length:663 start_codon:yes stop_codon:yes gene_type:complete